MLPESPWGCTAAALLPKQSRGTPRKHFTKAFTQLDDTDCICFLPILDSEVVNFRNNACFPLEIPMLCKWIHMINVIITNNPVS